MISHVIQRKRHLLTQRLLQFQIPLLVAWIFYPVRHRVNRGLGRGISKIPEVMRELHRQNFAHLIAIEYEKEGDVNRDMKEDVEFARQLA